MAATWGILTSRQAPGVPPFLTAEETAFNNAPQILSITGAFFTAAAIVVLLRCYVRVTILKVFGADDWVMLLAIILCAGTFVCFKVRCDNGLGKHMIVAMMNPVSFTRLSKTQYVQSLVVMVGVSSVKISIALQLLRLSTRKTYARILYGSMTFIVLMTMACAGTLIFQCLPVEAAWESSLRPPPFGTGTAKCYNLNIFRNLGLMNSSFNIITDVLFAVLPIPLIWQLQLNLRTKLSLIAILSLGWFASAAAIIKAIKQWHVLEDLDWTVEDSFNVWNFIEFTVGIIAACLPSLKPLFNCVLESTRSLTTKARSKGRSYNVSLGYENKTAQWNNDIAMNSFKSKGAKTLSSSPGKGPYHVSITGVADRDGWEAMQRKDSDDSIAPLQQPRHALASTNGIVMTREISVV